MVSDQQGRVVEQPEKAASLGWRGVFYNWLFRLLPILALAVAVLIATAINHRLPAEFRSWVLSAPAGASFREALIAIASVSAVVWTGALIVFQMKKDITQLSGAFLLLEYAFTVPLFGLFVSGPLLRGFAVIAAFAFLWSVVTRLATMLLFLIIKARATASDDAAPIFSDEWGKKILLAVLKMMWYLSMYALICALGTIAIVLEPTEYGVAWSSLVTLLCGLYLTLVALRSAPQPTTPSAGALKIREYAAALRARAAKLTKEANAIGKHA